MAVVIQESHQIDRLARQRCARLSGENLRARGWLVSRIPLMSAPYDQLIDATIQHLEELKVRGNRFVPVTPDTLSLLKQIASTSAPAQPISAMTGPERPATGAVVPSKSPSPAVTPVSQELPTKTAPTAELHQPIETVPVLDPQAKAAAMQELRERALVCMKCPHLANTRKNVVFGVGDINASLMFVGEAPGADEDVQGEPFVGAAGQLLTRIIQTMGLSRDTVYIANILKCRPDTPAQTAGNRKPTAEEMNTCIPYLHSQIDLIQPKVIVGLGGTALEGLLGKTGITKFRGNWQTYRGIPLMPTFHPSFLLRNQALSEKRKVWEDMLQVMEKLGLSITEKQRGYFLKA
jgi:DNA polymerase